MGDLVVSERLLWVGRLSVAQLIIGLLLVLNLVNIALPHAGDVRPAFLLMAIYYWAVFRPTLIPPVMTFIWGLLFDLIAGLPLGISALLFLAIQWVVRDQRLYLMGQSFAMLWLGFILTALVYSALQWTIFSIMQLTFADWRAPLGAFLLSVGLFPLVSFILVLTHRFLPHESTRGLR